MDKSAISSFSDLSFTIMWPAYNIRTWLENNVGVIWPAYNIRTWLGNNVGVMWPAYNITTWLGNNVGVGTNFRGVYSMLRLFNVTYVYCEK